MTCAKNCPDCECDERPALALAGCIWLTKDRGLCRKPVREGGMLLCEEHADAFVARVREDRSD